MIIAMVGAVLEFSEHFIPNFDPYGAIPFGIAFFFIFLLYLISPDFVFYSPNPIYHYIIIHKNGQMIYHYKNPQESINEAMIGSVIKAFVMFMEEFAKTKTPQTLEFVKLDNRAIICYQKEELLGLIIATRNSSLYKDSVRMFVKRFYARYKKEIKHFSGNISAFENADELVEKIFSYELISKKTHTVRD